MPKEKCQECGEELHECYHCHNEDCNLYTEEKLCEECGEELCYACDGICHECEGDKNKEDNVSILEPYDDVIDEHSIPTSKVKLEDDWVQTVMSGIKTVQPIMVIYAVPNEADHKDTYTCGIIVLKIFCELNKPSVKLAPVYRVITFPFSYESSKTGGTGKIVYPTGFRITQLFGKDLLETAKEVLSYVKMEIANLTYSLNKNKWSTKILINPLNSDDEFCKLTLLSLPLISSMDVSVGFLNNFDYDYSDCENTG